jgi:metallophosphoesterase superfamily enzyme
MARKSLEQMIKSAIIIPDLHMTDRLPKDYLAVRGFIKDFKPDRIVLLGDFMDVGSLSAWDTDKKRIMENKRFKKEIVAANDELDYLTDCLNKDGKIDYIEGNHEWRVERYLDKNPEMEGLIELPEKLGLEERNIDWYPYLNQVKNPLKIGDMHFIHGMYTNMNHAKKHLQALGCNVCYGHKHETQTAMQNMAMQKPYMAYGLGTLGDKSPDFMKGRPANWMNQFGVFYWDTNTGNFNLFPVNVIKNKFIWGGKVYDGKTNTGKKGK